MKHLIVTIIFVVFNFSLSCFAHLNPLVVTVSFNGEVKVELPKPCIYFYQSSLVSVSPSAVPIKVYNYNFRSEKDSLLESATTPNLSNENVMLFTFNDPKPIEVIYDLHQYKLNGWSNSKTVNLTSFEHAIQGHAYQRPQAEYELALSYGQNHMLKKMKLERTIVTKESSKKEYSKWKFLYKKNRLKKIKNENSTIGYTYDKNNNIISIISYTGNLKSIDKSYLSLDSLERYYDTKISTSDIWHYYSSSNTDIHEMVFYQYKGKKVVKMVSYSFNSGLQKTIISYDSLNRVSLYREYDNMGGIEIKFQYDENGKLKQRNERRKSDSYERGSSESEIMETYKYNSIKAINEVNCFYGSFQINGYNEAFKKIKKCLIEYEYINE
jgi:hypothetical protein